MSQQVSLFEVNENGEVIYNPVDSLESESVDNGNVVDQIDNFRNLVQGPSTVSSNNLEIEADPSEVAFLDSGDSGVPVVLAEEVTAAILAASPASGSIGSSTLDYFDRIVSGLPADYKYIAYRTSSDDSYDAVLYYGNDFEVSGNVITFGDHTTEIEVVRGNTSGYNSETFYYATDVSDTSISFSQSNSVLYYTNAVSGYPVLGGYEQPVGTGSFLSAALIGALCLVVLQKIFLRR